MNDYIKSKIKRKIESRLNKVYLSGPISDNNMLDYIEKTEIMLDRSNDELRNLKQKIQALAERSGFRGYFLESVGDRRALIAIGPLREEVTIAPNVDVATLDAGNEVLITIDDKGKVLTENRGKNKYGGRISKALLLLDSNRIVVEENNGESVLFLSKDMKCKIGDSVRYDFETKIVFEVISEDKDSSFALLDQPKTTFDDVKGLDEEKEFLKEKIIYPIVYGDKFKKYGLKPVRGVLFHGPSGCGKTFIGEAIFNEMLKLKGKEGKHKGFFLINGPEVLSKWAGNTEETIRKIFSDAREEANKSGFPSVIFWDEIESITGKRKDSATYAPEKTVIPTLLAEIQGINNGGNVVLIGATNRPDLIDPALLRPGRLGDAIIEIPRPDDKAAVDILNKEFNRENLPPALTGLLKEGLVQKMVNHCYANTEPLAYANKRSGEQEPLMRQGLVSGALFAQMGEDLVRKTCMSEINDSIKITIDDSIKMIDNILLMQIGILDAGVKNGFVVDTSDYIIDITMNG